MKTTGQVARELGVLDDQLAYLVRRRRIVPPPVIASGRRLWTDEQVRQAAELLAGAGAGRRPQEAAP